ncbi:hypothetical protein CASFOL_034129 [Castilleja foliolosa]|uniref:Uncharacterized protein n=1 Tax=Castilleja foliolosa TaxID=1961234 RepID=A0ABD3BXK0_9LAMI
MVSSTFSPLHFGPPRLRLVSPPLNHLLAATTTIINLNRPSIYPDRPPSQAHRRRSFNLNRTESLIPKLDPGFLSAHPQ